MVADKKSRIANAVGFLSGVLACVDALHDHGVPCAGPSGWNL